MNFGSNPTKVNLIIFILSLNSFLKRKYFQVTFFLVLFLKTVLFIDWFNHFFNRFYSFLPPTCFNFLVFFLPPLCNFLKYFLVNLWLLFICLILIPLPPLSCPPPPPFPYVTGLHVKSTVLEWRAESLQFTAERERRGGGGEKGRAAAAVDCHVALKGCLNKASVVTVSHSSDD